MTAVFCPAPEPVVWQRTTLGALSEYVTSGSRDWKQYYADHGALFIRTQDIASNRLNLESVPRVALPPKVEGKRSLVKRGDLLITITGNVGRVAVVDFDLPEAYVSQSVCLVRLKDPSVAPFLRHQLLARRGGKTVLEAMAYGLGRAVLNLENIRSAQILLAQPGARERIVAEIEKQFSRLDEAVANLKRVKANLKRKRAAVLKAAIEGRLVPTEADLARREGRDYESGSELLQRIVAQRQGPGGGAARPRAPVDPDTSDLPSVPEGWVYCAVSQVCDVASGNTPAGVLDAVRPSGAIPWFKVGDMNHVDNQDVMHHADSWLSEAEAKALGLRIFPPRTLLFPKRGGAIATNKKRLLAQPACADLNVMGITPCEFVDAFFRVWFDSVDLGKLSDGSNVPQINHKDIDPLPLPLPPRAEQERIVAEVDRRLSIVREVEVAVDANLKRALVLRQALLTTAFANSTPGPPRATESRGEG